MTTGLLIIVYCELPRLKAYESSLIVSFFSFVQTSFREFGEAGLCTRYIRFSQKLVGILGEEETLPWACQCNQLHSTICILFLSECLPECVATTASPSVPRIKTDA